MVSNRPESIVIGLTRMGILPSLARPVDGMAPDHMEGGVQDRVQITEIRTTTESDDEMRVSEAYRFSAAS